MPSMDAAIDFSNTEIAFKSVTTTDLLKAKVLFQTFGNQFLVTQGPKLLKWALNLHLPVTPLVKHTIFSHFCGGTTIEDSLKRVKSLGTYKVRSILDYSVEGLGRVEDFEDAFLELLNVTQLAAGQQMIPFTVFKITGLGSFELLEKISAGLPLNAEEKKQQGELGRRIFEICASAAKNGVRVLIDAEESWIQPAIDEFANAMILEFNISEPVVYNTLQMYRHDRLEYLKSNHLDFKSKGRIPGYKFVRGAYMEKERLHAKKKGYADPIQPDKAATDRDFNSALAYSIGHIDSLGLFAGTHNETSTRVLIQLMEMHSLPHNHPHIEFSQLLGMGDNLSFNLAHEGYNVSKYVPYGPIKFVLPYLIRRAQENSSIQGQASRELVLINQELARRSKK